MGTATIISVDRGTGEVMDGALVMVPPKRRNGFKEGWCSMGGDGLISLARSGLPGECLRAFMAVLGTLGWDNEITVSQADLARSIGLLPQAVNRAFRMLEEHDFIRERLVERANLPPVRRFFVNPHVAWKGDAKDHRAAMTLWDSETPAGGKE